MAYQVETGPVFPYPLRPSSFVEQVGVFDQKEGLNLSEAERTEIMEYEAGMYEELKEIKDVKVNTHEIYPAALVLGRGKMILELFYKQGLELKSWVVEVARSVGINMEATDDVVDSAEDVDKNLVKDIYKAVFEDLSEQDIQSGEVVSFAKFAAVIKEETGVVIKIDRTVEFDEGKMSELEVVEVFAGLDLRSIPLPWRMKINTLTVDWAKEQMGKKFLEARGEVSKIDNYRRVCRLTHPEKNKERLDKLHDLKRKIRKQAESLEDKVDKLSVGKKIVMDIYRKYINVQIADDELLWIGSGVNGNGVLKMDAGKMERYDRFVHGVGEEFDDRGNRVLLTKRIDEIAGRIEMDRQVEPIGEINITSDEELRICNWIISENKIPKCRAEKRSTNLTKMGIGFKKKNQEVIVYVPKKSRKLLPRFLATAAHEIEGHALSHRNWDNVKMPLKIMKHYSAGGRDDVLAEAVGKKVEKETRLAIDGYEDTPELNYYQAMKLRLQGGTFIDCVKLFFEARVKRDREQPAIVFGDDGKYKKTFDYAHSTAMRLFREHTPLDDRSGRLTTTDQLKYLEQESVVQALQAHGLEAVLFVNGPDLFSLMDLIRLGAFDLEKIQKPKMVVANKIWPILRDGLAKGMTVKDILDEQGVE